jgi:hypothetical protein
MLGLGVTNVHEALNFHSNVSHRALFWMATGHGKELDASVLHLQPFRALIFHHESVNLQKVITYNYNISHQATFACEVLTLPRRHLK